MRVSFLLPVLVSLSAWVASAHYHDGAELDAREWVDELTTRDLDFVNAVLERREILSEISTRELIDELSDRLESRGLTKKKTYGCPYCGRQYPTFDEAKACATLPALLGGCKVAQSVQQTTGSRTSVKSKGSAKKK